MDRENTSDLNKLNSSEYPQITNFSVIKQNVFAFSKYDAIGFINIDDGQVKFHHVIDKNVVGTGIAGISCISGHKYERIYAIGDISTPPRIILFTYLNEYIVQLKSRNHF